MDTNQALTLLLSNLRQKYNHYNSIMNSTKDLLDLADGRDSDSFGIILNMRENSMRQVDRIDEQDGEIISKLPANLRAKIEKCLRPAGTPITLENPLQTNIFDTSKRNNQLLSRLIEMDQQLRRRVNR